MDIYEVITISISVARLIVDLIKLCIEHKKSHPTPGK